MAEPVHGSNATATARIATIGDNCIDTYVNRDGLSAIGGNALNVAVGLAACDRNVAYVGPVGDDRLGRKVVGFLAARGIASDYARVVPGARTAQTWLELDASGDRVILKESYEIVESYQLATAELDYLQSFAHVHATWSPALHARLRELGSGTRVSFDFSTSHQDVDVDDLDTAFFSGHGLSREAAEQLALESVAHGAAAAVVTLGEHGSVACVGDRLCHVPAAPTEVIDTCGSGDSYIAAFLDRRLAGDDLATCMTVAAERAAQTCALLGASRQQLCPEDDLPLRD